MTEPRWRQRCAHFLWLLLFPFFPLLHAVAGPGPGPGGVVAPSFQPMHVERNWWVAGPGGRYGLLELTTNSVWTEPSAKIRRTTLLLGPWHWTVDLSAPQVLTVAILVTVITLFAAGWIRTRRYGL